MAAGLTIQTCSKRLRHVRRQYRLIVLVLFLCHPGSALAELSDSGADTVRKLLLLSSVAVSSYQRDYEGLRQFGTSLLVSSGVTLALKSLVDAERPNGEDNDSFPSGHATTSFAAAGYLHRRYGLRYGVPAYVAATAVAASRVDNDHHRVADVVAGALIALTINHRLVHSAPAVSAQLSPSGVSVAVRYRF